MQMRLSRHAPTPVTTPAPSRRRVLRVAVPILVLLLVAGAATAVALVGRDDPAPARITQAPRPVVDGNRLVDRRTGRELVPRGVTWSSLEYACAQGWGLSRLDALGGADPAAAEAAAIASWQANTVQLPLNQDCWLGTRGAPVSDEFDERTVADYRAEVLRLVDAFNDAGLLVVLELHSRKRVETSSAASLAMPDSESLAFWSSVASTYRDRPSVMFDAFYAPSSRTDRAGQAVFDLTWPCWRDGGCEAPVEDVETPTNGLVTYPAQGMARLVQVIREAGAEQPVILGGIGGARDVSRWLELAPRDDQLVASFHTSAEGACVTEACWDSTLLPLRGSVPVLTGEVRASSQRDPYVRRYLAWAERHRIGAIFWVWTGRAGDPTSLVSGPTRRPTPYGVTVRAYLSGRPSASVR